MADDDALVIPEPLTAQLLRQRQAALARLSLAARGLPPGVTANQLAAAVHADLTDGHPATWPAPLDRAPGAVAAAPPGDEEVAANVDLHGHMALTSGRDDDFYPRRARLCRLLDAGWRFVPPDPPAGHEDEAAVERADPVLGYYARLRAMEPSDELLVEIKAGELVRQRELAAARGPRTPDPGDPT